MLPPDKAIRSEIEIKRSRFITSAARAVTVSEARAFITAVRGEFPDARHHCSAYSVSDGIDAQAEQTNPTLHSSDDGEPSGTAGKPMLDVLIGSGLSNIVCVVTRYFGGTLLGTGGLVRAYSDAVREALNGTPAVTTQLSRHYLLSLPHVSAGKTEADIRAAGFSVTHTSYLPHGVQLEINVLPTEESRFTDLIAELTKGTAKATYMNDEISELPAGTVTL